MQRHPPRWFVPAVFAAAVLLAVSLGQRRATPPPLPLDDWQLPELVAHLKRAGLRLRMAAIAKNGAISPAVFLTTEEKPWRELNGLSKDPKRIAEWRGVLYCEYRGGRDQAGLARLWGEDCLTAGPFIFYGDAALLARVRDALAHPASGVAVH
jgi:hypothetical protein